MKTSLTVLAICLLSFSNLFSQGHKVSGTAVLNNYKDRLEYKNLLVMLINKQDSIAIDSVYVLTDSLGNYCFNDVQSGEYVLELRYFLDNRRYPVYVGEDDLSLDLFIDLKGSDLAEQARRDIELGEAVIYAEGGMEPIIYGVEEPFKEKFGIQYIVPDCVRGPDSKYWSDYNMVIFNYLTERFGNKWKAFLRKDTVGYKQWKRNKKHR